MCCSDGAGDFLSGGIEADGKISLLKIALELARYFDRLDIPERECKRWRKDVEIRTIEFVLLGTDDLVRIFLVRPIGIVVDPDGIFILFHLFKEPLRRISVAEAEGEKIFVFCLLRRQFGEGDFCADRLPRLIDDMDLEVGIFEQKNADCDQDDYGQNGKFHEIIDS